MSKPRRAVREMQAYDAPDSGRERCLRLDFNENTAGCSPAVIRSLRRVRRSALSMYPEYAGLEKALAGYCNVMAEEVVATNGSDEAISAIMECYVGKGDEVILPVPTYAMFSLCAQRREAVIREIPYNRDLSFPARQVLGKITRRTKIVILVSPNNPTGTSIRAGDMQRIIRKASRNSALVLVDEAYYEFCGKTSVPLVKAFDNLFVTRTFSKAFGLAGLRLGYMVSCKGNIQVLRKVLSPSYSVNAVAALCAPEALRDLGYVRRYAAEVKAGKRILCRELNTLGLGYYRSDANFVLANIGPGADALCRKLGEKGIIVRNLSRRKRLEGCVRITVGTVRQTRRLVKELRNAVRETNPLLIFDMDGVLVDVSKSYRLAIRQACEYFTKSRVSVAEIQEWKNRGGLNSDYDLAEAIVNSRGEKVGRKELVRKFQGFYRKVKGNERWLLDRKLLEALSKRYALAIFTGRPRKEALYALRENNARPYFKTIVAAEDVIKQKPDPEGLLKIKLKIKTMCDNPNAYYFGDSADDMQAGFRAGIAPVGVLPPQDRSAALKGLLMKKGAVKVLRNINRIPEVLK